MLSLVLIMEEICVGESIFLDIHSESSVTPKPMSDDLPAYIGLRSPTRRGTTAVRQRVTAESSISFFDGEHDDGTDGCEPAAFLAGILEEELL